MVCILKKKIDFKKNLNEVIGIVKPISMELDTKKLVNNFNFKFKCFYNFGTFIFYIITN